MDDTHTAAQAAGPAHRPGPPMLAAHLLRSGTRSAHAAVESLPLMTALMSVEIDARTYAEVLQRQLRIHAGWERAHAAWLEEQPWRYRPRAPGLRADLATLQCDTAPEVDVAVAAPVAGDDASAWGMLYVVEGAALGGRLIARHVRAHCVDAAGALRHFDAAPADAWPRFQRMLERALPDAGSRQRAVSGARAMFAHFHAELAAPH